MKILRTANYKPRAARKCLALLGAIGLPVRRKMSLTGFTLLELLITMALVSSLLVAVWMVYSSGFKAFYSQWSRSGVKGEFGRMFLNLSPELRQAGSLLSAQVNSLGFTVDTDNDGSDESIQYSWSGVAGNSLNRISSYTAAVLNSVNTLVFSYYDAGNNILSFPITLSQVRLISIDATVTDKEETFRMRSKIRLRNL